MLHYHDSQRDWNGRLNIRLIIVIASNLTRSSCSCTFLIIEDSFLTVKNLSRFISIHTIKSNRNHWLSPYQIALHQTPVTLSRFIHMTTNYLKLKFDIICQVSLAIILQMVLILNLVRLYYDVCSIICWLL